MASLFSLRPALFRTRNPARDAATDRDRLMPIRHALAGAIAEATRERQGLQQRVDVHYARATTLLDNSAEYGVRSDEDERSISDAEANAARATARIAQIDTQIAKLNDMLAALDETGGAA